MSELASDLDRLFSSIPSNQHLIYQQFILENGARAVDMPKRSLDVEGENHLENQGQQHNAHHQEPRSAFDTLMSNRHLAIPKSQKRWGARRREHHATVVRKFEAVPKDNVEGIQEDFDDAVFLRPMDEVNMDMDDA